MTSLLAGATREEAHLARFDIKTLRIYGHVMKLLNVRLDDSDVARVRTLRSKGVAIAGVVRNAIRAEYDRRARAQEAADVEEVLDEIYRTYPAPPPSTRPAFDPHDRRQFREAMRRHVRRRR